MGCRVWDVCWVWEWLSHESAGPASLITDPPVINRSCRHTVQNYREQRYQASQNKSHSYQYSINIVTYKYLVLFSHYPTLSASRGLQWTTVGHFSLSYSRTPTTIHIHGVKYRSIKRQYKLTNFTFLTLFISWWEFHVC